MEQLYNALSSAGISESDMTYVTKQYNEFNSRAHTISLDPYNERAREYMHKNRERVAKRRRELYYENHEEILKKNREYKARRKAQGVTK